MRGTSPKRSTLIFGKKGELASRYIGPFRIGPDRIMSRVGDVAYRLELTVELTRTHDIFHVSMLKKYVPNPSHVIQYEPLQIRENATYVEKRMRIIDIKEQV